MANAQMTYREVRFEIDADETIAYVLTECPDFPLAEGWWKKTFKAPMNLVDILKTIGTEDGHVTNWERKAPFLSAGSLTGNHPIG